MTLTIATIILQGVFILTMTAFIVITVKTDCQDDRRRTNT